MMAFKIPVQRYRPEKEADGEGGFTETLSSSITVYGTIQMHENAPKLLIDWHEDVVPGDVLGVTEDDGPEQFYRVSGGHRVLNTRLRNLDLQRIERPIWAVLRLLFTESGHPLITIGGHPLALGA